MKPLKPVMAATLAACLVVSPFAGLARAQDAGDGGTTVTPDDSGNGGDATQDLTSASGDAAPNSGPVATPNAKPDPLANASAENDPINIITNMVQKDQSSVRKDIGDRIADFLTTKGPDGKYVYLSADFNKDDDVTHKTLDGVLAAARDSVKQGQPGDAAVVYFVMGPDHIAPDWVANDPTLSQTVGTKWLLNFTSALASQKLNTTAQLTPSGAANGITAFLNIFVKQAWSVFDDPRTKASILSSLAQHDTGGPNFNTLDDGQSAPSGQGNGPDSGAQSEAGAGFGFNEIYRDGAETAKVYNTTTDKGKFRELSVKIYSTRDEHDNVINRIGIVDITDDPTPSKPQFININGDSDSTIKLYDNGTRNYHVTVKDGLVTIQRAEGTGGMELQAKVSQLIADRNQQIMGAGTAVLPDGQTYYVLGQGGAKGSLLYFSQKDMMQNPNGPVKAALMGDVTEVVGDGSTSLVQGKPNLGKTHNDSYHLEYDNQTGLWKVVNGIGDVAKKPTTPTAPPNPSSGGSTNPPAPPSPGGGDSGDGSGGGSPAGGLDAAVQLQLKNGWALDVNANKSFSAFASDGEGLRVLTKKGADGGTQFQIVFDVSLQVDGNAFSFGPDPKDPGAVIQSIRCVYGYIEVNSKRSDGSTHSEYYYPTNFPHQVVGTFDSATGAISVVAQTDILSPQVAVQVGTYLLTKKLKVAQGDAALSSTDGIFARVAKYANGKPYTLTGDLSKMHLHVSQSSDRIIWPQVLEPGDTGSNDGLTGLRGPGTAVGVPQGDRAPFQATMDMPNSYKAKLVATADGGHAALYTAQEDENFKGKKTVPSPWVWYVMIDYKTDNGPSRTKAIAVFGGKHTVVPNGFPSDGSVPANGSYQLQGLADVDMSYKADDGSSQTAPLVMLLYGSTPAKGAIVAYRRTPPTNNGSWFSPPDNVPDTKSNCGGAVIAWGSMTLAQATTACQGDSWVH